MASINTSALISNVPGWNSLFTSNGAQVNGSNTISPDAIDGFVRTVEVGFHWSIRAHGLEAGLREDDARA